MTGEEKIALLLGSLPPQTREPILARMAPADAAQVRARLQQQPPEEVSLADVAREFSDINRIVTRAVAAPPPAAPAPPAESATPEDPVEALRELPPEMLSAALKAERPATVALTLGFLDVAKASAVLKLLPPDVRRDAVARQLEPSPVKPELVGRVLSVVLARCKQAATGPAKAGGSDLVSRQADLLRSLDREDRKQITERLEQADPALAGKVRKLLYRFSDVMRVDDRTLQTILSNLEVKPLATALKGAPEELKTKILNNVSRRARDNINEEMELLTNAQPAQIEEAQAVVTDVLRKLDEEGSLTL